MTAVYVIRHPETTWNLEQRYQGRLESTLSPHGRAQGALLIRAFAGQQLDAVYSSPLSRAVDLARELARTTDAPLCADERLIEIAQGPWEGLTLPEIRSRFPQLYDRWYARPDEVCFPGGEGLADVRRRALAAAEDVFSRYPAGSIALVTHSVVVQILVATALGLDLQYLHRIRVSNASVTTLCGSDIEGSLLSLNDTEPLYHDPMAAAGAQHCATWRMRRVTQ